MTLQQQPTGQLSEAEVLEMERGRERAEMKQRAREANIKAHRDAETCVLAAAGWISSTTNDGNLNDAAQIQRGLQIAARLLKLHADAI